MEKVRIWNLKHNMKIASITVQVLSKSEIRQVTYDGTSKSVCDCQVTDGTGAAILSVWGSDIHQINKDNIVNIKNGKCEYWGGLPQIKFKYGEMKIREKSNKDFIDQSFCEACNERLPMLIHLAKQKDPEKRLWALNGFKKMKEMVVIALPTLLKLLNDENDEVRQNTLSALMNIKDRDQTLFPALLKTLKDPNPKVRHLAVLKISHMVEAAKKVFPQIVEMLKDENKDVRIITVTAIKAIKGREQSIKSFLQEIMKTNDRELKWRAFESLRIEEEFEDRDKPFLFDMLKEKDSRIRKEATMILEKIGYLTQAYKILLESKDTEIIDDAFRKIKKMDSKGKPLLEDALDSKDEYVRKAATYMLKELAEKEKKFKEKSDRRKDMFDAFHQI